MKFITNHHPHHGNIKATQCVCFALLAALVLLCGGCAEDDTTPPADIIKRTIGCSDQQAQNIFEILTQCGATKLQNIKKSSTTQYRLYYPEGVLWLQVDREKNLRAVAGQSDTTMYLYRDGEVLGTLIDASLEAPYYFDTTSSMIASIEDMLVVKRLLSGTEEAPKAFDYNGERFAYRTLDGIVHVSYILYGHTDQQKVRFPFEAEYAMLHPISLKLDIPRYLPYEEHPEEEHITYVWNGTYYEAVGASAGVFRAEAANRANPFTEDEINRTAQAIQELQQGDTTKKDSYGEIRAKFQTKLMVQRQTGSKAPTPPEGLLSLDYYDTAVGKLAAYLSPDPGDGQKHPAIIWIAGGFDNSIDDFIWDEQSRANDQSARALYQSGIITMYPSFRGGNENPGSIEILCGEIDDVIAAYTHVASLDYVDANRIYLAGHSTGGTLALLVAESFSGFRGVFALGPVGDIRSYGTEYFVFDTSDDYEYTMRSPIHWLVDIKTPTFIFEGKMGNYRALLSLLSANQNPCVSLYAVEGADHFNLIAPLTELIAEKVLMDTQGLSFTQAELSSLEIAEQ